MQKLGKRRTGDSGRIEILAIVLIVILLVGAFAGPYMLGWFWEEPAEQELYAMRNGGTNWKITPAYSAKSQYASIHDDDKRWTVTRIEAEAKGVSDYNPKWKCDLKVIVHLWQPDPEGGAGKWTSKIGMFPYGYLDTDYYWLEVTVGTPNVATVQVELDAVNCEPQWGSGVNPYSDPVYYWNGNQVMFKNEVTLVVWGKVTTLTIEEEEEPIIIDDQGVWDDGTFIPLEDPPIIPANYTGGGADDDEDLGMAIVWFFFGLIIAIIGLILFALGTRTHVAVTITGMIMFIIGMLSMALGIWEVLT